MTHSDSTERIKLGSDPRWWQTGSAPQPDDHTLIIHTPPTGANPAFAPGPIREVPPPAAAPAQPINPVRSRRNALVMLSALMLASCAFGGVFATCVTLWAVFG